MFKQFGISSVELLVSLSIMSSATAFTLSLADEVEASAKEYQQETNAKELLKKIRAGKKVP